MSYHSAATLDRNTPVVHSTDRTKHHKKREEQHLAHLHHVDDVVRQPEKAERHHDGQDEVLAAHLSAELGLPEAPQDEHVARDDDGVREDESRHRLKGVLEPHLQARGHE